MISSGICCDIPESIVQRHSSMFKAKIWKQNGRFFNIKGYQDQDQETYSHFGLDPDP